MNKPTTQTYLIQFENLSEAEANRYARELREALLDASPDVSVELKPARPNTQDFWSELLVSLTAGTTIEAAKAIGGWLIKRHNAHIRVTKSDGSVVLEDLAGPAAEEKLAQMFLSQNNL